MCYTVGNKTRKRVGYKVVEKRNGKCFSLYAGTQIKKGKIGEPKTLRRFYYQEENVGRVVAYRDFYDALTLRNLYILKHQGHIIKVWLEGDVREGMEYYEPVISATHIKKFKEIKIRCVTQ